VNVRIAIQMAEGVLELTGTTGPQAAAAIAAAKKWLDDPSEENATAADAYAYATDAATAAYGAANAYAYADATAAAANGYAYAYAAADYHEALIAQLDLMLDAWEEAVTKEGEDLYIPREWEEDALKFVADMMLERSDVDEMMNK
jgi:L-lactate utilization protein LutB